VTASGEIPPLVRAPDKFELKQVVSGGRHTLALSGELDLASASILEETIAHIDMGSSTKMVLDLSKLTFIDLCGVRAILAMQTRCAKGRCEFEMLPGQPDIQRMFATWGLLDRLPFLESGSEATTARF
jgi:anti-sigma B factor antagonist